MIGSATASIGRASLLLLPPMEYYTVVGIRFWGVNPALISASILNKRIKHKLIIKIIA
jgi:hypothetical protein